jgi:hypothetical protein
MIWKVDTNKNDGVNDLHSLRHFLSKDNHLC